MRFELIDDNAMMPTKSLLGYKLYANTTKDIIIWPGVTRSVTTGIKLYLDGGECALVHSTSSSKFCAMVIEGTQELKLQILNTTNNAVVIHNHELLAKIFFVKALTMDIPCGKITDIEVEAAA